MILIRFAKIAAIYAISLFFLIVFINNLIDYNSNFMYVEHVLSMDSVFPGNCCSGRAIKDASIHHIFYWLIIITEGIASILCGIGASKLLLCIKRSSDQFNRTKGVAALGLMTGFLLMVFGFMTVGGEWFFMWQSEKWGGGLNAALRVSTITGLVFLMLLHSDSDYRSN